MKNSFYIQDWAGNVCFGGVSFKTFQDAWGFIYEFHSNNLDPYLNGEDWFQEYLVLPVSCNTESLYLKQHCMRF